MLSTVAATIDGKAALALIFGLQCSQPDLSDLTSPPMEEFRRCPFGQPRDATYLVSKCGPVCNPFPPFEVWTVKAQYLSGAGERAATARLISLGLVLGDIALSVCGQSAHVMA